MQGNIMHQKCNFFLVFRNGQNLAKKAVFLDHFDRFFVYALLRSLSYAPRFLQMKYLIKIYSWEVSSIYYLWLSRLKFSNFFVSIQQWLFLGFVFAFSSPNVVALSWNFHQRHFSSTKKHLNNLSKICISTAMERTQPLQFWSIFEPNLPSENVTKWPKTKFFHKATFSGLSDNIKLKSEQKKTLFGQKMAINCPLEQNRNSHIAYLRTIYSKFLGTKSQLLGVYRSWLYPRRYDYFFWFRA